MDAVVCPIEHLYPSSKSHRVFRDGEMYQCADCGTRFYADLVGDSPAVELKVFDPSEDVGEVAQLSLIGPAPPDDFVGDGCTCCPDSISGFDIREACRYHDWAYILGGTEAERLAADRNLLINVILSGAPHVAATIIFRRVRAFGPGFSIRFLKWRFDFGFNYEKRSPTLLYRLWLLVARYVQ